MISFNERLRWMKYSNYFMAITQQAWGQNPPTYLGNASAMAFYPVNPMGVANISAGVPPMAQGQAQMMQPQVVRVPARVIRLPKQQVAVPSTASADFIAPTVPETQAQSAPRPPVESVETVQPIPSTQQHKIPQPDQEMQSDPYNDLAEALAEGLTQTPPDGQNLPPYVAAPVVDEPQITAPRKRASFAEALAMNSDQPTAQPPQAPVPSQVPSLSPELSEASTTLPPILETDPAIEPSMLSESTDASVEQEMEPATLDSSQQTPKEQSSQHQSQKKRDTEPSVQQTEQVTGSDTTDSVISEAANIAETKTETVEENAKTEHTDIEQQETDVQKRKELEDLLRATNNGEPVRLPRLPRPKAPSKSQKKVEEDKTPPVTEVPTEVAQNLLARLNRLAEMEQSGEAEGGMSMPYSKLENWQDHNPSENVGANEQVLENESESAMTEAKSTLQAPLIPEPPSAQPAAKQKRSLQTQANTTKVPQPRLKAKPVSSKRGKKGSANKQQSVRQANQAKGDKDDEAERGTFAQTDVPQFGPEVRLPQSQRESLPLTEEIAEAFAQTTETEVKETESVIQEPTESLANPALVSDQSNALTDMTEHVVQQTQAQQVSVISPTPEFGKTAEQTQSDASKSNVVAPTSLRPTVVTNTPESRAPAVPTSGAQSVDKTVQRIPAKLVNVVDPKVQQNEQNLIPQVPTFADSSQQKMSQVNPVLEESSLEQQAQRLRQGVVPVVAPQMDMPVSNVIEPKMSQVNSAADLVSDHPMTQNLVSSGMPMIAPQPAQQVEPVAVIPVSKQPTSQPLVANTQQSMSTASVQYPTANINNLPDLTPMMPLGTVLPIAQKREQIGFVAPQPALPPQMPAVPVHHVMPASNQADQGLTNLSLNTSFSAPVVVPVGSRPVNMEAPITPIIPNESAVAMPVVPISTVWSEPMQSIPSALQNRSTSTTLLGQPTMPVGMPPQPAHSSVFPALPSHSIDKMVTPQWLSESAVPNQPQIPQLATEAIEAEGHGQPLPLGAQEALQRTLGTSVKNIRVVRNPRVGAALDQAKAEALTVDQTVLLPQDIDLETPAGHALAAHEYTHALRKTQPQFVPEVLRRQQQQASQSPLSNSSQLPKVQSEEEVALATEHAAHQEFSQQRGLSSPAPSLNQATQPYNGLPAPHEPMPFWSDQADQVSDSVNTSSWVVSETKETEPRSEVMNTDLMPPLLPDALAAQGIFAAEKERPKPSAPSQQKQEQKESDNPVGNKSGKTPSQDLDHLAHDVYNRLRDRLSDELRRLRNS